MFPTINAEYLAAKHADSENRFILESVLDVDETLPGSDEEMESIVDPDSVPDDVYAKIDKELDKIVEDPDYDDTEAEEMLDDDFDVDDISDAEIDAIMDEAITMMDLKDKVAGVFANLSEKAGNNMGNNTGMGLLKTLSESVNQFHGGKMSDPIGQAYEPVETPKGSIDETKLENEALRESAVDAALARFHSLMEASNPDVEDFPGKEGTTTADGDTPAGMPEPNGNEDGNNIGGDDDAVDYEQREVGVEDGGDDVIDVIKANEAVNRYRAVVESITNPDVEDFPNQTGAGNDHGEKEGALPQGEEPADFPNSTGDKKVNSGDVPTNRYKAVAEAALGGDLDEKVSVGGSAVSGAIGGAVTHGLLGAGIGAVASKDVRNARSDLRRAEAQGSKEEVAAAQKKLSEARKAGAKKGAKFGAAIGVVRGAAKGANAANRANAAEDAANRMQAEYEAEAKRMDDDYKARVNKMHEESAAWRKAHGFNESVADRYRAVVEAVTMKDVEDFPKGEGTHSAEGNGVPAGMSHEDDSVQPAYTDQSDFEQKEVGVEDGGTDAIDVIKANETANRYRALIEAVKAKKNGVCPECGKNPCECEC